jgi:hypothetical protein
MIQQKHKNSLTTSPPQSSNLRPLLPPIHPTSTIHTPLRPLTNILTTILTFNLPLNNIIPTRATIRQRNGPKRHRNSQKPHYIIQKIAIREHHSTIVYRLFRRIVARGYGRVVIGAVLQDGEFLIQVAA